MKHEQGYTDGGRNQHYDGLFDGETDADKERRIQWAINEDQLPWPGMMAAFENYYGQSWFDRDWRDETAIWAAAWKAAKTHNVEFSGTPAALSPEAPLERRVGPGAQEGT